MLRFGSVLLVSIASAICFTSCSDSDRPQRSTGGDTVKSANKKVEQDYDVNQLVMGPPRLSREQTFSRYLPGRSGNGPIKSADFLKAANVALGVRDYDAAMFLLDEVVKANPNDGRAYLLRGRARCNSAGGTDVAALEDLKKAVQLGCSSPDTYKFMASIYDANKEPEKAIEALTEAIKLSPREKSLYQARGTLYFDQGQKENAMRDYDRALRIDPSSPYLYVLRAQLFESMQSFEAALRDYESAIKLEHKGQKVSTCVPSLKRRAALYSKMGRHKESVEELTRAVKLEGNDDDLYRLRGQEYYDLNLDDKAISDFSKAIELAPQFSSVAYEARGRVYERTGKKELAKKDRMESKRLQDAPAEKPLFKLK